MAMNNVSAHMFRPVLSDVVTRNIHIQHWEPMLVSNSTVSVPNYVYELLPCDGRSRDETRRKIVV